MKAKKLLSVFMVLSSLLIIRTIALAANGDPLALFTANTAAGGTSLLPGEMEQHLLNRLSAAQTRIDAAIYILNRDSVRDALIAAHNLGVTVRVVTDNNAYQNAGYAPYFQALEGAGIPVVTDNHAFVMHNTFFVIDGSVVWTGSTDMTDAGFSLDHNNSLIFTGTQVAGIYTLEFEEMFGGLFGTGKFDNVTHTLTYAGSPLEIYFSPSDQALAEIISEVNAADTSIYFATFAFSDNTLREAIVARMGAGVTVQGIFDQHDAGSQFSEDTALCTAGAQIKIETFSGALNHRFMIIDPDGADPVVVTGSMDWSLFGNTGNDENTVIIHDAETAQAYLAAHQTLYNALDAGTLCTTQVAQPVYLPLVLKSWAWEATPTPTAGPPVSNLKITKISFSGDDEYVQLRNDGAVGQAMAGWTLVSAIGPQIYEFPASVVIAAGQTIRIHSGPDALDNPPNDLKWSDAYIWRNSGDRAELFSDGGALVDSSCYGNGCP